MNGRATAILLGLLACGATLAESVPLIHDHGIFLVPVVINDKITLNFTVDSGASDVSIPADVVSTLTRTGTIVKGDFLDAQAYELADGSTRISKRFRIRSLRVGNLELRDVMASVAPLEGSLLLGQSFLSRTKSWSMDNERHLLVINESPTHGSDTTPQHLKSASLPHTQEPPAQSAGMMQANDAAILKAVTFALTGDDGAHVQDWPDCVYIVKTSNSVLTFHLNNVDPGRVRISADSSTETSVHLSGESTIVDAFAADPNLPSSTLGSNKVLTHHTQWTLHTATVETDRMIRAWSFIYSHGCTGRKGSF